MKSLRKTKYIEGQKMTRRSKLSVIVLSLIALVSFFILVMPYLPRLWYLLAKPKINSQPYEQARTGEVPEEVKKEKGNRLVLPQIGVNAEVIDGSDINVIGRNQGVWRETPNLDPTKPGNLVLAGHRFLYTARNGGHFYNLTELKASEKIYIKWENQVYAYEVTSAKTVKPTQVEIRDADPDIQYKLTMYTCFPLGSTAERFVVEAKRLDE